MRKLILALVILMFMAPVSGHELKEYTVMVNSSGVYPADIPDNSMKEGDSAWFWMKDSTEDATLIVKLEKDGLTLQSPVLQYECELNDNQTEKLDDSCETRFDFTFNRPLNIDEIKKVENLVNDSIRKNLKVKRLLI